MSTVAFWIVLGCVLGPHALLLVAALLFTWPGEKTFLWQLAFVGLIAPVALLVPVLACMAIVAPWHTWHLLSEMIGGLAPFFVLLVTSVMHTWIPLFLVSIAVLWYLRAAARGYGHFASALGYQIE